MELLAYLLRHADDNLVLAQRLGEWVSNAPELEEDIALANLALDHLGQARAIYQYAATVEGEGRSEDDFAMFRNERDFTNLLLVEQPNGDFATTMARQLMFDAYQLGLWEALAQSSDTTLSGIAAKALKEARYHFRHSSTWVIRLGDGTSESHDRMQNAVDNLWRFSHELFEGDDVDKAAAEVGIGVDPGRLREAWDGRMGEVLEQATLRVPTDETRRSGGRAGSHSEHLGHLLAEMQWMQRSYPGVAW
jgi:ring-1,2-phenylacetyl-CoA epoxidase subunit PaaC